MPRRRGDGAHQPDGGSGLFGESASQGESQRGESLWQGLYTRGRQEGDRAPHGDESQHGAGREVGMFGESLEQNEANANGFARHYRDNAIPAQREPQTEQAAATPD
jgi:hypothetical protein